MAEIRTEYVAENGLACSVETPKANLAAIDLSCDRLLSGRTYILGRQDLRDLETVLKKYLKETHIRMNEVNNNGSRNQGQRVTEVYRLRDSAERAKVRNS